MVYQETMERCCFTKSPLILRVLILFCPSVIRKTRYVLLPLNTAKEHVMNLQYYVLEQGLSALASKLLDGCSSLNYHTTTVEKKIVLS